MAARLMRNDLLYDGCYAHVISRSIGKQNILRDQEDLNKFLKILNEAKKDSGFRLFHYCLMPTHFHIAVSIPEVRSFSKAIQQLKSRYIYYYHFKYRASGPAWRERFKSLIIENDSYMYACGIYIENNPVAAGIVKNSVEWKYSSKRYYCGEEDDLVDSYGTKNLPGIPDELDLCDEEVFENEIGIGSGYFKYLTREGRRAG